MNNRFVISCLFLILSSISYAQIGYQVSLLNNATGEPRANERVTVTVKITDSEGKTVCEETKNETTNDFGVVSMSVGNSVIFANANWSKLPFFIEASVDGRLLGKSQLLSVPVAEYAKRTGTLSKEILMSKVWDNGDSTHYSIIFKEDTAYLLYEDGTPKYIFKKYIIDGDHVLIYNAVYYDDGYPSGERGYYYFDGEQLVPIIRVS